MQAAEHITDILIRPRIHSNGHLSFTEFLKTHHSRSLSASGGQRVFTMLQCGQLFNKHVATGAF